jgi:hypothetical protein
MGFSMTSTGTNSSPVPLQNNRIALFGQGTGSGFAPPIPIDYNRFETRMPRQQSQFFTNGAFHPRIPSVANVHEGAGMNGANGSLPVPSFLNQNLPQVEKKQAPIGNEMKEIKELKELKGLGQKENGFHKF